MSEIVPPRNIPLLEMQDVVWQPAGAPASHGIATKRGISLRVEHGSIVGLLDQHTADTSFLADCMAGQQPVSGGSIRFNGQEITNLPAGRIARLGLLRTHRHPRLFSRMTCLENMLASSPRQHRSLLPLFAPATRTEQDRAIDLLALVGLHAMRHHHARHLFPAERVLLELAMALMAEPQLLLLDSPTASLAPPQANALANLLRRINAELGITMLLIEQDAGMIMHLADYIYSLADGAMQASGPPEAIAHHLHDGTIPKDETPVW